MKITISPSEDQTAQVHPYYSVTTENHSDDSFTAETAVKMFVAAMTAFGFDREITQKAMHDYTY
jgi:hypothetical protein